MSFRRLLTSITLGTAILVLAATLAFGLLDRYATRAARTLSTAIEDARVGDEVRAQLIEYERMNDLAAFESRPMLERDDRERSLLALLDQARRRADEDAERAAVARLDRSVRTYFAILRGAEERHTPLNDVLREAADSRKQAFVAAGDLSGLNLEEASAAEARALHFDRIASRGGLVAAALLVAGMAFLLYWVRRVVYDPMAALSATIRRYGAGDRRLRAVPKGPTEIEVLGSAFNEMADALAEQHTRDVTYIAAIAHELRNPLSALKLATTRKSGPDTIALVGRQVARLERLVSDLLEEARIEAGQLELRLEVVDLAALVDDAVELQRSASAEIPISWTRPTAELLVRCDATRITQVVANLLSNAVRYSPSGGAIEVGLQAETAGAVLFVRDHGIGIATADQRRIFEPFARTRAAKSVSPGVGLGLSVSRRIVEAHGGAIELESTPGEGSTFRVRLALVTRGMV